MTELFAPWLAMMSFHVLAVLSPGPDFALILKNSLHYSRKKLMLNSLGIASGVLLHSSYTSFGISWISNSWALQVIHYLGGAYFLYLGIRSFQTILKETVLKRKSLSSKCKPVKKRCWNFQKFRTEEISNPMAYIEGFLCNLLNPKAIPYFLSFYSVFISVSMSYGLLSFYVFTVVLSTFLIFVALGTFFTLAPVQAKIIRIQKFVIGLMAVLFILLGLYLWMAVIGLV